MGLFTSNCPACCAKIDWFLEAPVNYVCQCGRPMTSAEIETSWLENYKKRMEENALRRATSVKGR